MLRVLIIDDEANIRAMIAEIVKGYCDGAEVVGQAGGVKEGVEKIHSLKPELVLLDIKMDDGTGFDLLEKFDKIDFKVIFITAYQEYALKAIKFSALDYILKPVDPDELIKAVQSAGENIKDVQEAQLNQLKDSLKNNDQAEKKILLKTAESIHLIHVSDIIYCQADGGYTRFFTGKDKMILVSKPMAEYEELLHDYGFFRVHKSYLLNLEKVQRFEKEDGGYVVMPDEVRVPVASRKRELLMQLLVKLTE
ncbi:MAG: LytTR family DNA-binding domain-containing protein [Bacteroidales bacterium]|nr:LytTR family DNA-binding domain-containing protein [Bacteroidales bacterium]